MKIENPTARITLELESTICTMFESLFKHKPEMSRNALAISIRNRWDCYGRTDRSFCNLTQVIYFSPSNYTKVMWREVDFRTFSFAGEYELIADHDSCWREAWSPITLRRRARLDEFLASFRSKGKDIFDNSSLHEVKMLDIGEFDFSGGYRVPLSLTEADGVFNINQVS